MINWDALYGMCDEFYKEFYPVLQEQLLPASTELNFNPSSRLSTPELMTILIAFHQSGFHDLKHFFIYIQNHCRKEFPKLVSYTRFVELMPTAALFIYGLLLMLEGACSGTSFIDATALSVCKNKRISSHRVFKGFAKRGKNTMGWFFGFKLHLVINEKGHLLSFTLTGGNVHDVAAAPDILKHIFGKIFGDKGYISKALFEQLFIRGCQIVTAIRNNMKPKLVALNDSINLGKRSLIESVFNVLKNSCRLEHSRHRSPKNFVVNLLASLCSYMMRFWIDRTPPFALLAHA